MLVMLLLSHAGDGVAELVLTVVWCRRQVMLMMMLLIHVGNHDITRSPHSCLCAEWFI
jgi:hypothetical protein